MRSSISKKNPYWISKYRYYELKYLCLQYPEWKRLYLNGYGLRSANFPLVGSYENVSDPTGDAAVRLEWCRTRMELVEQAALYADGDIYQWLLKCVTEGVSYDTLRMVDDIPCGRDYFYKRYRKLFWILDKLCTQKLHWVL